jgi:hypothetical protein
MRRAGFLLLAATACVPGSATAPSVNDAPMIRSVTASPDRILVGGTTQIRVDAIDPNGDRIFYHYSAEAGTITVPDAANPNQAVYVQNGLTRELDTIRVVVTDVWNAKAESELKLPLQGNRPPAVTLSWGEPNTAGHCHPECVLTVQVQATDPDGDALSYQWAGCATGQDLNAPCHVTKPAFVVASVVVSDGHGGVTVTSLVGLGTNAAPVVRGGAAVHGPHAELRPSFEDPDGDAVTCGWSGDCTCTGDRASTDLTCDVPGNLGSCAMLFVCTDSFGAQGQTRYTVLR